MTEAQNVSSCFLHRKKSITILFSSILLSCHASAAVHSKGSSSTIIVQRDNELSDFETDNIFSQSVVVTSDSKTSDPSSLIKAADIVEDAYRNCNSLTRGKICRGDTEGCVESKTCSHMSALIMNETHYNVLLYSKCNLNFNLPAHSSFLSVTINDTLEFTVDEATGNNNVTCAPLVRENFKFFLLWPENEPKCDGGTEDYIAKTLTFTNDVSFDDHQEWCANKSQNATVGEIPHAFDFVYWHEHLLIMAEISQSFNNKSYSEIEQMVDYKSEDNIFYISTIANIPTSTTGETTTENLALNHRSYFSLLPLLILTVSLSLL